MALGPISFVHARVNTGLHAQVNRVIDDVLFATDLPAVASKNSRTVVRDEGLDYNVTKVFQRLNISIFPADRRFQIKTADINNFVCDTERKFIIVDPALQRSLLDRSTSPDLTVAALLAHEMGHYFYAVFRQQQDLPILQSQYNVPSADEEHAWVELIAAELLRRSGYSDSEIEVAFFSLHKFLSDQIKNLSLTLKLDPSTDTQTRRAIIREWLAH